LLELTTPAEENSEQPWTLSVDGASNIKGSAAGVVLEGPDGVLIEQSLRFAFKASNNEAEYEALIAGMKLAREMDITDLKAKSDSQLVTNQVLGEFQAKDPQLIKYLEKVRSLASLFRSFELIYVPWEQNARANLLSKLASTKKPESNRTFIQETIANLSITAEEVMMIIEAEDWRAPIIRYLQEDVLPAAKEEAYKLKRAAAWYSMLGGKLYKRRFSGPIMLCVSQEEAIGILEEIHE
jgi:ribonuclease HI